MIPKVRYEFQSTLPAWGETERGRIRHAERGISIHSPRMGRDIPNSPPVFAVTDFNPLSPHGERPAQRAARGGAGLFQSTLPAWVETVGPYSDQSPAPFQSTLPAWGETRAAGFLWLLRPISIHSPRMGRDMGLKLDFGDPLFQSTLPAWGETGNQYIALQVAKFQSTLPAWGETRGLVLPARAQGISIHSPRMGRDATGKSPHGTADGFQSTLPAWGETAAVLDVPHVILRISIHSPRRG